MDSNLCAIFNCASKLNLKQLIDCHKHFGSLIEQLKSDHVVQANSADIHDFVELPAPFIDPGSTDYETLCSELEALDLRHKGGKNSKFLSSTGQSYTWYTSAGKAITKETLNINTCPTVHKLLNKLVKERGLRLNCCLASCLVDGSSSLRLHADDEDTIDQSQPICVLIIGADRRVDLLGSFQRGNRPTLSFVAGSGELYSMLPGCQDFFQTPHPWGQELLVCALQPIF